MFFSKEYLERIQIEFYEGIIYEDNLFTLNAILSAERVGYLPEVLFKRRVREGSTITGHKSYFNFRSYLVCILEMYKYSLNNNFNDKVISVINDELDAMAVSTCQVYGSMVERDKRIPWIKDPNDRLLMNLIYDKIVLLDKTIQNNADKMTIKEFSKKKVKGGIQCLKDNGILYTIKRLGVHFGLKK